MEKKERQGTVKAVAKLFRHPFLKFVVKKGIWYLIIAFIAFNLVFFIPRLKGEDPVEQMITTITPGEENRLKEQISTLKEYYGTGKPIEQQYVNFWSKLFSGDLGVSIATRFGYAGTPVSEIVLEALPYTLALVVPVLFVSFFLGNWIGARAAYIKTKRSEAVYFASVLGNVIPYMWFAMVLAFIFSWNLKIFPLSGTFTHFPTPGLFSILDGLHHYLLPFFSLLVVCTGGWATGMRSMTLYELDGGYILYSRQLGFKDKRLISYAKRNALLPQFTGLNINLNNLISQTMVVEIVFGWKGLGLVGYNAAMSNDWTLLAGTFIVTAIVVILGNFLVDITYAYLDPRIRTGYGG
jgi:peptide/nickel transport system permease protein